MRLLVFALRACKTSVPLAWIGFAGGGVAVSRSALEVAPEMMTICLGGRRISEESLADGGVVGWEWLELGE